MQHAGLGVVLIASLEIETRVDPHIARGHLDVTVVGDVDTGGVVHLVIGARGNGEGRHGPLAMVEDSVDVGGEYALIGIVDGHGRIGPPQKGLRHVGAVVEHTVNLEIGTAGTEGEAGHALLMRHPLHLAHPYGHTAVGMLPDGGVDGQVGRRAVMLRPVELYSPRNPRAGKPHECRLDDMVVVDKMALPDLVVGHLYAPSQLRENHHLDVFVFQIDRMPRLVCLLVADRLYYGVRIDRTARALIHPLLQEDGIFLGRSDLIRWDQHRFFPCFYHKLFF